MKAILEIIAGGFQTSVQDLGRWGFQEYGIPVSGSAIPQWMKLANIIVGNKPECAGLEYRLMGPSLKAREGAIKLCVAGDVTCELIHNTPSGKQSHFVQGWRSFTLQAGDEVRIGSLTKSMCGFVAVGGGIETEPTFNSRSLYARSKICGDYLQSGDLLALGANAKNLALEADRLLPSPPVVPENLTLRLCLGPQDDYFTDQAIDTLLTSTFEVTREADRMGMRLAGPILEHKKDKGAEIASDGVAHGAIQVPGNGQAIVLLNDGQTVGGYPKIATIISSDLPLLANAPLNTKIRFEKVSPHQACLIAREQVAKLKQIAASIIAAKAEGFINLHALYETNLIGGVVDMEDPTHFPEHLGEDE